MLTDVILRASLAALSFCLRRLALDEAALDPRANLGVRLSRRIANSLLELPVLLFL